MFDVGEVLYAVDDCEQGVVLVEEFRVDLLSWPAVVLLGSCVL